MTPQAPKKGSTRLEATVERPVVDAFEQQARRGREETRDWQRLAEGGHGP